MHRGVKPSTDNSNQPRPPNHTAAKQRGRITIMHPLVITILFHSPYPVGSPDQPLIGHDGTAGQKIEHRCHQRTSPCPRRCKLCRTVTRLQNAAIYHIKYIPANHQQHGEHAKTGLQQPVGVHEYGIEANSRRQQQYGEQRPRHKLADAGGAGHPQVILAVNGPQ